MSKNSFPRTILKMIFRSNVANFYSSLLVIRFNVSVSENLARSENICQKQNHMTLYSLQIEIKKSWKQCVEKSNSIFKTVKNISILCILSCHDHWNLTTLHPYPIETDSKLLFKQCRSRKELCKTLDKEYMFYEVSEIHCLSS